MEGVIGLVGLIWVCWGYSETFTGYSPFFGNPFTKLFLKGVTASSQAATAGIAFKNAAARREQEARIAQIISHGGHVPTSMSIQGQTIQVNSDVYIDGTKVATAVTNHQTKNARHRAVQTSGIHAGKPLP